MPLSECDVLRGQLLALRRSTHKRKEELASGDLDALRDVCAQADTLVEKVEQPREQAISSEIFLDLSDVGVQRSERLTENAGKVKPSDVIEALKKRFVRKGCEADELDWKKTGHLAAGFFLPGVAVSCMLGPLSVQPKVRTSTQRRRTVISGPIEKPRVIQGGVPEDDKSRLTDKNMETMIKVLRNADEGVPFAELVLNPDSFSQTVENVFTLAFLVKDRRVSLSLDGYLGMIVTAKQRAQKRHGKSSASEQQPCVQSIMKFNFETFRLLKKIVAKEDCKMPSRKVVKEACMVHGRDEGPSSLLDAHKMQDAEESLQESPFAESPEGTSPTESLLDITHLTQQGINMTPDSIQTQTATSKRKRECGGDEAISKRKTHGGPSLNTVD